MNKLYIICLAVFSQIVLANEVKIVDVSLVSKGAQHYRVNVTLLHEDTGWDHYADGWKILDENKKVIGQRILHHPHVNEQPFTRSLHDVVIPEAVQFIYIRAHDKIHGDSTDRKVDIN
ncbi:MAG: hypothetical protein OEY29_05830 [Gammaproteobacteria bacterium]|nr:hypothetical protein [Gammaproteobacteria bacterium]